MIADNIKAIQEEIGNAKLVVVSKNRTIEELNKVYEAGHRDFGENRVQHLLERHDSLPEDINWHMIGHLQTNKVKMIAPFISLIHSVDSLKLLNEINKQAAKHDRVIPVLFQLHLGAEESKFGLSEDQLPELIKKVSSEKANYGHIDINGLMGMASNTDNKEQVRSEFRHLRDLFDTIKADFGTKWPNFQILSMGMSGDYREAILEKSNMVRIGSAIFSTN